MSSCEGCSTCSFSRPCSSGRCTAGESPSVSSRDLATRCAWDRAHSIRLCIGSRNEASSHVEMATERNIRLGMSPDDARRAAILDFAGEGGREEWREQARDEVRSRVAEEFARDVRYAIRGMRRAPGFTAAAVATLALSVGATSSIFSVVNATLLEQLPYPHADRIVAVCEKNVVQPAHEL